MYTSEIDMKQDIDFLQVYTLFTGLIGLKWMDSANFYIEEMNDITNSCSPTLTLLLGVCDDCTNSITDDWTDMNSLADRHI